MAMDHRLRWEDTRSFPEGVDLVPDRKKSERGFALLNISPALNVARLDIDASACPKESEGVLSMLLSLAR